MSFRDLSDAGRELPAALASYEVQRPLFLRRCGVTHRSSLKSSRRSCPARPLLHPLLVDVAPIRCSTSTLFEKCAITFDFCNVAKLSQRKIQHPEHVLFSHAHYSSKPIHSASRVRQ